MSKLTRTFRNHSQRLRLKLALFIVFIRLIVFCDTDTTQTIDKIEEVNHEENELVVLI